MRIADSSFLYALIDHADSRRPHALAAFGDPEPIGIPPEVTGELLGLVHKRIGFREAALLWSALRAKPHVRFLGTSAPDETSVEFRNGLGALSWVDAAVVHWCKKTNSKPLCFDAHIEAAMSKK